MLKWRWISVYSLGWQSTYSAILQFHLYYKSLLWSWRPNTLQGRVWSTNWSILLLLSCAVFKSKVCYVCLQQTNVFITVTNNILSNNLYARLFQAVWRNELNHGLYLLNKAFKCAGCWSLLISTCQNGVCKSQGRLTVHSLHHLWVNKLWWVLGLGSLSFSRSS